jgi:methyltransferase (TIGR00027 family)
MALFRAVETARPRGRLFEDPYAAAFLTGPLQRVAAVARWPGLGGLVPWLLDLGWPRTRSSGIVRTRLIDDQVRDAISAGARQFVLLGAGFDSRPYRLPEAASVTVYEVDHPATQQAKRARLSAALPCLPANVRFVPVDFEKDDLEAALRASGFDPTALSVVVWEGVVSYLTPGAVDQNFRMLARIMAQQSRLIFSYVDRGALDGSRVFEEARRWKWWVGRSGEPFIFGFDPATLAHDLRAWGFELLSDTSTADAARSYRQTMGRNELGSELYRIALCERAV